MNTGATSNLTKLKNITNELITDELLSTFNWHGTSGKLALNKYEFFKTFVLSEFFFFKLIN